MPISLGRTHSFTGRMMIQGHHDEIPLSPSQKEALLWRKKQFKSTNKGASLTDLVHSQAGSTFQQGPSRSASWTTLHYASRYGHNQVIPALIECGADVNLSHASYSGVTALHDAASHGHNQVILALLEAKADVNASTSCSRTPLHKAASSGHSRVIPVLIEAKADVNARDRFDKTPLGVALECDHQLASKTLRIAGGYT
eukprot:TRINITY_DN75128_c0_g1_i1.p1 TRINITY_DN75128_c0_g1~~TRINITY_DN75128_c0_g1_i1.p1  ORF type:complete len:215 (+),score=27.40 TRINITY_DN75128_c0_g1_i1:49-645(+)